MKLSEKHIVPNDFETVYLKLRYSENRIYSDEEVSRLPVISRGHPHFKEWRMRDHSSRRIVDYLRRKHQPLTILEVGCGNGWLSKRLSGIADSQVLGIDINTRELEQAARVFQKVSNLRFAQSPNPEGTVGANIFDIILFASSIQYFKSLPERIEYYLSLLRPDGEIHIMDSPFYTRAEIERAKHRSVEYYRCAGFPEMADYYFHHSLDQLTRFNYSVLFNPKNIFHKLSGTVNPFYWIRVMN